MTGWKKSQENTHITKSIKLEKIEKQRNSKNALENFNPLVSKKADIIELDGIYTYVKKEKSSNRMDYLF